MIHRHEKRTSQWWINRARRFFNRKCSARRTVRIDGRRHRWITMNVQNEHRFCSSKNREFCQNSKWTKFHRYLIIWATVFLWARETLTPLILTIKSPAFRPICSALLLSVMWLTNEGLSPDNVKPKQEFFVRDKENWMKGKCQSLKFNLSFVRTRCSSRSAMSRLMLVTLFPSRVLHILWRNSPTSSGKR